MSQSMMLLMRNASPKRKGRKPKMTKDAIYRIVAGMPEIRSGRTEYLKQKCKELGVQPVAFYAARRRLFTGVN